MAAQVAKITSIVERVLFGRIHDQYGGFSATLDRLIRMLLWPVYVVNNYLVIAQLLGLLLLLAANMQQDARAQVTPMGLVKFAR